jgi:hypothetical protein
MGQEVLAYRDCTRDSGKMDACSSALLCGSLYSAAIPVPGGSLLASCTAWPPMPSAPCISCSRASCSRAKHSGPPHCMPAMSCYAEWRVLRVTALDFGGGREASLLVERTEGDAMKLRWPPLASMPACLATCGQKCISWRQELVPAVLVVKVMSMVPLPFVL